MAKKSAKREFDKAFAAIVAEQQATATVSEAMRADLERRRSGAHGAHAKSSIRRDAGAGRKSKMGSRSARRNAAVRDCF